ncbi:MAG: hypothetical protein CMJ85_14060, partial [Planctomycetes bacterium]|nr:hypothetical protein [Planctomycetota bacterium]
EDAFRRLAALTNYERKRPDRPHRFDLDGMKRLCARIGHPERRLGTVFQVGGSKGKGTVTALLAAMLRAAGTKVGAYYSPHVLDVRERVRIDGAMIDEPTLASALERVVDRMKSDQTWFEVFTVVALACFADARVGATVLEVGLGGRLDTTTAVAKHGCCITGVELEHTRLLGDTIAAVAGEKAGILRPGVPCVTGAVGDALAVLVDRAAEVGAPLLVAGRDFEVVVARGQSGLSVAMIDTPIGDVTLNTPLRARVHGTSLALAFVTLAAVLPTRAARLAGGDAGWAAAPRGRFEVVQHRPPIVVDGAHTDDSLSQLAADLAAAFPGLRFSLVFTIASGKRWQRGLGRLLTLVDKAWVAPLVGKRGVSSGELSQFINGRGVPCQLAPSVQEAACEARGRLVDGGLVVTGSMYAAGDALRVFEAD